jgi:hypothetical protein
MCSILLCSPGSSRPLAPGISARQSHDYERHGVSISTCYRRHRHQEFLRFLNEPDGNLPVGLDVHIVMDHSGHARFHQSAQYAKAKSRCPVVR